MCRLSRPCVKQSSSCSKAWLPSSLLILLIFSFLLRFVPESTGAGCEPFVLNGEGKKFRAVGHYSQAGLGTQEETRENADKEPVFFIARVNNRIKQGFRVIWLVPK
jgi:hypothetical protein